MDRLWGVPPLIQMSISKILSPECKTKLRRPLNYGGPEITAAPKFRQLLNCGGPKTMTAPNDPLSETMSCFQVVMHAWSESLSCFQVVSSHWALGYAEAMGKPCRFLNMTSEQIARRKERRRKQKWRAVKKKEKKRRGVKHRKKSGDCSKENKASVSEHSI